MNTAECDKSEVSKAVNQTGQASTKVLLGPTNVQTTDHTDNVDCLEVWQIDRANNLQGFWRVW